MGDEGAKVTLHIREQVEWIKKINMAGNEEHLHSSAYIVHLLGSFLDAFLGRVDEAIVQKVAHSRCLCLM